MIRLILWPVKMAILAVVILVLGQIIEFDGRTVSDQIKVTLSQVMRSDVVRQIRE